MNVQLVSFQDEGADLPFAPPMKGNLYLVPNGIRPVMQRTAIEVCSPGPVSWKSLVPFGRRSYSEIVINLFHKNVGLFNMFQAQAKFRRSVNEQRMYGIRNMP